MVASTVKRKRYVSNHKRPTRDTRSDNKRPWTQIKCDEQKPSCGRCRRFGVRCPGYTKQYKWSAQYQIEDQHNVFDFDDINGTNSVVGQLDTNQNEISMEHTGLARSPSPFPEFGEDVFTNVFDMDIETDPYQEDWRALPEPPAKEFPLLPDDLSRTASDGRRRMSYQAKSAVGSPSPSPSRRRISSMSSDQSERTMVQNPLLRAQEDTSSVSTEEWVAMLPMLGTLIDPSSILVEYYFKEVAGLFSCYDSRMNPFRTTVSRLWNSSPSIYYTVQSMAAACLGEAFPQMTEVGLRLRSKAASSVESNMKASRLDTGSLLALIMLGLTASWHDASDIGLAEFETAREAVDSMLTGENFEGLEKNERNMRFFQEALVYWEMLLSYVSDSTSSSLPEQPQPDAITIYDSVEPRVPHPWTGVGCDAQVLVFEIGSLVREERNRIRRRSFTYEADIDHMRRAIERARSLEQKLRGLALPVENVIVNPGDDQTPVTHFLNIAECYRCAGLLQLYRVFPDLLVPRRRLSSARADSTKRRRVSKAASDPTVQEVQSNPNSWLTNLSLHVVSLLESMATESRTRCVQPFLLVAVASELQLSRKEGDAFQGSCPFQKEEYSSEGIFDGPPTVLDVVLARKFVLSRLSAFEHILPAKPIRQMLALVRETWQRIDEGRENVYWMDVMIEKGYETMMG